MEDQPIENYPGDLSRKEEVLKVLQGAAKFLDEVLFRRWIKAWRMDLSSQDFAIELCELRGAREAQEFVQAHMNPMVLLDLDVDIETREEHLRALLKSHGRDSMEYRQLRGRLRGMSESLRLLQARFDQAFPAQPPEEDTHELPTCSCSHGRDPAGGGRLAASPSLVPRPPDEVPDPEVAELDR